MEGNNTNVSVVSNQTRDVGLNDLFSFSQSTDGGLLILMIVLIFICDLAIGLAMWKSRTLTFSTKLYTCLSLLCDCIALFLLLSLAVVRALNVKNQWFEEMAGLVFKIVTSLSWTNVTMLLVDKVLCLYRPSDYLKFASSKRIITITGAIYTSVIGIKLLSRFLLFPLVTGDDITLNTATERRPILTSILGVCILIDAICFILIAKVLKRHVRNIADANTSARNQSNQTNNSQTLIVIFFVFMAVHVPLFATFIYHLTTEDAASLRRYALLIANVAVCFINPLLYAWRFREVRYLLLAFIARVLPFLRERADAMRVDIYNIVTAASADSRQHIERY